MAVKKWFTVNAPKGLNLREKPTQKAKVLKVLADGERIEADNAVQTPDGWIAVKDGGFVMKAFLK